jgi:inhibitor of KinA sporulation pathway (predicted exonuclease)
MPGGRSYASGMNAGGGLLNVVDVEATCWDGEPPAGQVSEIIEIGLAVADLAGGRRVERHRILVRPERSAVSAFCTELTGLTQADADSGVSFEAACRMLEREHAAGSRAWASWGDYDRRQFERQCQAVGVGYPFGAVHVNAKAAFGRARGLRRQPGMATALRIAGLPLEGRHHSGADDAWNIAALILGLHASGQWPVAAG